ncbi:ADP-ribose pyrophosphatase YjhB, NUDIX family [Mucilaginibacter lappiensis]|uniref:ADP-ribose pyrophosphatase YjhB (NUDIX family) n=1 Tax=Mucilaginibacter lappiensis TaxID=354630 RepID=A0ABR6PI36_9SPHI|nr:NUDIX domain-containing protein [Mucilaginibacter lappiensis]MBB6109311.1 ADP-ribose pyrophosphatase YjhB (NUDIX family) [Mucilaginibacter lappiensis]SIR00643.1 ADP-ribose pyrophosphatase YjhB, NUDIX family [Mucilaginibacter lappiensis]
MNNEFIKQETNVTGEGYLPGLAIDTVIFGFHDDKLKVLILSYKDTSLYALPGGFVHTEEDVNEAARRVLFSRTGLTNIFLDQFYVFGDKSRYDASSLKTIMKARGFTPPEDHWLLKRFVSVGYYALVDFTKAIPTPDSISDSCDWFSLDKLPPLMQDHRQIIDKALQTLQANLDHKLIGFNLLSDDFTMGDLQRLYETVLNKKLIRAAFQRKMLGLGILERIAKKWTGGAHKAPYLYRFIARD